MILGSIFTFFAETKTKFDCCGVCRPGHARVYDDSAIGWYALTRYVQNWRNLRWSDLDCCLVVEGLLVRLVQADRTHCSTSDTETFRSKPPAAKQRFYLWKWQLRSTPPRANDNFPYKSNSKRPNVASDVIAFVNTGRINTLRLKTTKQNVKTTIRYRKRLSRVCIFVQPCKVCSRHLWSWRSSRPTDHWSRNRTA